MKSTTNSPAAKGSNTRLRQLKRRLRIAVVLSVVFGLGWGLGLPATQLQKHDILRYIFQISFNTLTAFQGVFIFILHCVSSSEIRKEWKSWLTYLSRGKLNNISSKYSLTANSEKPNRAKAFYSVNPLSEKTREYRSDISRSNFNEDSQTQLYTERESVVIRELTVFENKLT